MPRVVLVCIKSKFIEERQRPGSESDNIKYYRNRSFSP